VKTEYQERTLSFLTQPEKPKVPFLLDGIELVMIGGDQGKVQAFRESEREGIGKRDSLGNFDDTNPLNEHIIRITTKFERKRQGVSPGSLGCSDPIITKEIVINLPKVTDMHGQKGAGMFDEFFEDFCPWLLTQVSNDRAGIQAVGGRYGFHRRSSWAFSSCLRLAKASLLV
jgi:hypothetical protein